MLNSTIFQKLNKYANSRQIQKTTSSQSTIEQLNQAQQDWFHGEGLEFFCPELTRLNHKAIDASSGSSAFVPPDIVTDELKRIAEINLIEYNCHVPTANFMQSAEKYFRQIGIIDKQISFYPNVYFASSTTTNYSAMVGHGTTDLYNRALSAIIKTKGDVIIITEPTYGLFVDPILSKGAEIATLKLSEGNQYKPEQHELKALIANTNKEKKQQFLININITKQLLEGLPKNKLQKDQLADAMKAIDKLAKIAENSITESKFIKLDARTTKFNQSLEDCLKKIFNKAELQQWKDKLILPHCPRVRGYLNINPHMPMGTICDQEEINALAEEISKFSDVTVIDDLTYYDLILPPTKITAGTFAKSLLKDKTITLYSPSKQYAIAGIRSGICFGNQSYMLPITKSVFYGVNSTSIYSDTALHAIFRMKTQDRKNYLAENNTDYALKRDLIIALIQGTKDINPQQLVKIKAKLSALGVKKAEHEELLQGIKDLSIVLKPESGFFILIDFSKYKGKYLGKTQLNKGTDFRSALLCFTKLDTISGELSLYFEKPVLRFSYSIPMNDILESIYRIRSVLALCQDKPFAGPVNDSPNDPMLEKKPKTFTPRFKAKTEKTIIQGITNQRRRGKRMITPSARVRD